MDYLLLGLGLMLLIVGADGLVKGASRLAASFGVPTLVIGLTVVAFGTSAPELAVSVRSAFADQTEMAIANVVGSNIFNVLFILGLSALIAPLVISKQLIRQDVPIMVGASLLIYLFALDGVISRIDAAILFVLLIAYTAFLFIQGKRVEAMAKRKPELSAETEDDEVAELIRGNHPVWQSILWVVLGLSFLLVGAKLLVGSAVNIARAFEVSEAIIGLTIIAIGTSLPEVVTSIVATLKGQRDIAVGNVVGSNTFNILAVLGVSGIVSSQGLVGNEQLVQQDFPIMLGVALLCLPLFFTGAILSRIEGGLFFGLYLIYTLFLIGIASQATWLAQFDSVFFYLVLPATLFVVVGSLLKDMANRKRLSHLK